MQIAAATMCCADGFVWRAGPATIPSVHVMPSNEPKMASLASDGLSPAARDFSPSVVLVAQARSGAVEWPADDRGRRGGFLRVHAVGAGFFCRWSLALSSATFASTLSL